MQNIESYCQELHPYTDGQSSQRVLNAANEFLQSNEKLKAKPLKCNKTTLKCVKS